MVIMRCKIGHYHVKVAGHSTRQPVWSLLVYFKNKQAKTDIRYDKHTSYN